MQSLTFLHKSTILNEPCDTKSTNTYYSRMCILKAKEFHHHRKSKTELIYHGIIVIENESA